MVLAILFSLVMQAPATSPLDEGLTYLKANNWPMAEASLLGATPTFENLHELARALTQTTLLSGNPPSKQAFWRAYLEKEGPERALGLAVLAGLAIADRDWDELQSHAEALLTLLPDSNTLLRHKLLYHLARHTRWQPTMQLAAAEADWFERARLLTPQQRLPKATAAKLPFALQHAYLLEMSQPFELPAGADNSDADQRMMMQLLQAQRHVLAGEDNLAAQAFNTFNKVVLSDFDVDLRAIFYPVQRDFYLSRDLPQYAERVQTRLDQMRLFAPFLMLPDSKQAKLLYQKRMTALAAQEAAAQQQQEAERRSKAAQNVGGTQQAYLELEAEVMLNPIASELRVRALDPITTYEKAKKNYLLGWIFLRKGRLDAAMERLELARQLIQDYPFYLLKLKILYASHQYYEALGDTSRSLWYAVSANQIYQDPANLGHFATVPQASIPDITGSLIDNWLVEKDRTKALGQVLYLAERKKFRDRLRFAFENQVLSEDDAANARLAKTGEQMRAMMETLAHDPNAALAPEDYNDMLDQWVAEWAQVRPYYADTGFADLAQVQARLQPGDRWFVFVEGDSSLGLIVISDQQSFLLDLGSRSRFLAQPPAERLKQLVRRIGVLLEGKGQAYVAYTASFMQDGVLQDLVKQAQSQHNAVWFSSVKDWLAATRLPNCGGRLVLYPPELQDAVAEAEDASLVRLAYDGNLSLKSLLNSNHNLAWLGDLEVDEQGTLIFGNGEKKFTLADLLSYQSAFCTLLLRVDAETDVVDVLSTLRLLDPRMATSVFLINDVESALSPQPWQSRMPGVRLLK